MKYRRNFSGIDDCLSYFDNEMIGEICDKVCGKCKTMGCEDCEATDWCDDIQEILLECAIRYIREELSKVVKFPNG